MGYLMIYHGEWLGHDKFHVSPPVLAVRKLMSLIGTIVTNTTWYRLISYLRTLFR